MNFTLSIGGAEAAGFFKEATGFDSQSEVVESRTDIDASNQREGSDRSIDGASIRGDVTSKSHVQWLQIASR